MEDESSRIQRPLQTSLDTPCSSRPAPVLAGLPENSSSLRGQESVSGLGVGIWESQSLGLWLYPSRGKNNSIWITMARLAYLWLKDSLKF